MQGDSASAQVVAQCRRIAGGIGRAREVAKSVVGVAHMGCCAAAGRINEVDELTLAVAEPACRLAERVNLPKIQVLASLLKVLAIVLVWPSAEPVAFLVWICTRVGLPNPSKVLAVEHSHRDQQRPRRERSRRHSLFSLRLRENR